MSKKDKVGFLIHLDSDQKILLDKISPKVGLSISCIIRRSIDSYLDLFVRYLDSHRISPDIEPPQPKDSPKSIS